MTGSDLHPPSSINSYPTREDERLAAEAMAGERHKEIEAMRAALGQIVKKHGATLRAIANNEVDAASAASYHGGAEAITARLGPMAQAIKLIDQGIWPSKRGLEILKLGAQFTDPPLFHTHVDTPVSALVEDVRRFATEQFAGLEHYSAEFHKARGKP